MPCLSFARRLFKQTFDTAAQLFALEGFDAVDLDRLMTAAGLTRGAFYHHFQSKTDLYGEAIAHAAREGGRRLELLGRQGLTALVEHYLSLDHLRARTLYCPLAFMAADVTHREPAIRQLYSAVFERLVARLQALLPGHPASARCRALQLAATLIGGLALARTLVDVDQAEALLAACRQTAQGLLFQAESSAGATG